MEKILLLEARLNYSNEYQETVQEFEVTREMPNTLAVSSTYETGFVNDKRISKNQLNEIKGRGTRALYVFITEDQDKQEWFQKMREEIFNRVERHYLEEKARYEAMCKVAGYVEPSVTSGVEVIKVPEVEMHYSITNGMPSDETMNGLFEQGYVPLLVAQAKQFHPYATNNGAILFYAKPIDKAEMDKFISEQFPKEVDKHDS